MKLLSIMMVTLLVGASALAYKDGTYNCKNSDGLPDNVYKISTHSLAGEAGLPYLEVHRFYKNENGKTVESVVRGLASVIKTSEDTGDTLMLGLLRIEFDGDSLYGCKQ